jgi:protein-tyrosine phosphatase
LKTKEVEVYVKIEEKERKVKVHLPIFDGSKPEILLYCVGLFNTAGKNEPVGTRPGSG